MPRFHPRASDSETSEEVEARVAERAAEGIR